MRFKEGNFFVVLLDTHTAMVEKSIGAIQRRVMLTDNDLARAQLALQEVANL